MFTKKEKRNIEKLKKIMLETTIKPIIWYPDKDGRFTFKLQPRIIKDNLDAERQQKD